MPVFFNLQPVGFQWILAISTGFPRTPVRPARTPVRNKRARKHASSSTLADWLNNLDPNTGMLPVGQPGDPAPPTFSASTFIVGVNVGVGSGWGNNFLGFADNITLGFGGNSDTYRFEQDVPVELMRFTIE